MGSAGEEREVMDMAKAGGGPSEEGLWARTELPQDSQPGTAGFCAWRSEGMPEGCVSKGLNKHWALPKNIYLLLYACGSGS